MDFDERVRADTDSLVSVVYGLMKNMWHSLPVIAQSSDGHTMKAQSSVHGSFTDPGTGKITTGLMEIISDIPVHFAGGGGVTHTHPVKQGDEGILQLLSRPQDSWWQNGGSNNDPIDARMHDLSDARYIPGGRSNPRKMNPAPSASSGQARSDDGKHVVDYHPQNGITHASVMKVLSIVGGLGGSGTLHTIENIVANAAKGKVLLQTVKSAGIPPPGQMVIADAKLVVGEALPAISSLAQSIMSSILN